MEKGITLSLRGVIIFQADIVAVKTSFCIQSCSLSLSSKTCKMVSVVCPIWPVFGYKTAGFKEQHMCKKFSFKLHKTTVQTYVILKRSSTEETIARIFGF